MVRNSFIPLKEIGNGYDIEYVKELIKNVLIEEYLGKIGRQELLDYFGIIIQIIMINQENNMLPSG